MYVKLAPSVFELVGRTPLDPIASLDYLFGGAVLMVVVVMVMYHENHEKCGALIKCDRLFSSFFICFIHMRPQSLTFASRYPLSFSMEVSPSTLSVASNINVSEHVYGTMGNKILDFSLFLQLVKTKF